MIQVTMKKENQVNIKIDEVGYYFVVYSFSDGINTVFIDKVRND